MKTALLIVLAIIAVLLVVSVMLQNGNSDGLSAVSGGSDALYGKKKSKGYDEKLSKLTVIFSVAFLVVNIVVLIIE